MHKPLKSKITQIIAQEQISVAAFERRVGLSRNVVQNILRGTTKLPSCETLQAIAEACHCSVEELTSGKTLDHLNSQQAIAHPHLLNLTFKVVYDFITVNGYTFPSFQQLLGIMEEIYNFSLKSNTHEVDVRFAEWLLEKTSKAS